MDDVFVNSEALDNDEREHQSYCAEKLKARPSVDGVIKSDVEV